MQVFTEQILCVGTGTICIVDDSEIDLFMARRSFSRSRMKENFHCLEFLGGDSFLRYIKDEILLKKHESPKLVCLDINMPDIDGFEVLKEVRHIPNFVKRPPFIMLTNSQNQGDIEKSQLCGANGYQIKPFSPADYIAFFDSLAAPA